MLFVEDFWVIFVSLSARLKLANVTRGLLREPTQAYRMAKSDLDRAIREFDQALWDQTREVILGIHSVILSFKSIDLSRLGCGTQQPSDLIDWLSPSYWECIGQLSTHKSRHFDGTLRWVYLMPELNSWLVGDAPSELLWLTGLPGVGKSIISAHIITTIIAERPELCLLYFFCKDGEHKLTQAQNIVQTLSYQMALRNEGFRKELERTRLEEKFVLSPALRIRLLYNRLFQQPLSSLTDVEEDEKVYCVIDGLDEADFAARDGRSGDPEVAILLKLFATTPRVRLLVLSRSSPQICDTMLTLESTTKEIGAIDNKDDIELYVQWKVLQSSKLEDGFRRLNIDPVTHVRKSANGNFCGLTSCLSFWNSQILSKNLRAVYLKYQNNFMTCTSRFCDGSR